MKSAAALTRRSLFGLAALGLAACKSHSTATPPRVDPDAAALASARAGELRLIGATTDLAQHSLHLEHLAALGGSVPSPLATPVVGLSVRAQLRGSAEALSSAAVAAIDGATAALLASIAASHEVMAGE